MIILGLSAERVTGIRAKACAYAAAVRLAIAARPQGQTGEEEGTLQPDFQLPAHRFS